MRQSKPPVPAHLTGRGADLWAKTYAGFELEPHHLEILTRAAEQLGRADEAAEVVKAKGVIQVDRFGQCKPNPAVEMERMAVTAAARLLRELGLDLPSKE